MGKSENVKRTTDNTTQDERGYGLQLWYLTKE